VVTPIGLADASSVDDLLRGYVAKSRTVTDFDKLPIPFRAVATDMMTGDMVVLDRGDIAIAMRASMAIPGAFSPVVLDPYILSDGGMVRNIPIDVARNTCADIVIVVNLVEPPPTREKLVQAQQLLSRSMDVMFEVNEKAQLATLTDRDILINVPMGDITTGDFDRLPETIPLGEAAARKVEDRLKALSVPEDQYLAWRNSITTSQAVEARVADVKVEGLDFVNPEYLRTMMEVKPGRHGQRRQDQPGCPAHGRARRARLRGLPAGRPAGEFDAYLASGGNLARQERAPADTGPLRGRRRRLHVPRRCPARPPVGQLARCAVAQPAPDR
jgi:NTE family protein